MKRFCIFLSAVLSLGMLFCSQAKAQGRIDLSPQGAKAESAQNVTMSGFSASFSYNSIESTNVSTEKGVFSVINMGNSVAAGNIGEPQVPVTRELIAVPFGATPVVTVKSYTVKEYNLSDYGIERIYPKQPSQSKSEKEVKFVYNEAAYAAKGFDETRPIAEVNVMGTMRGIQIGALQINALRYNAAANTVRVYNDIELEVSFKNADLARTESTLVNTYSPYFRTVYSSLYNSKAINDIYDEHPDLWAVPVKILVVANRMFEEAMQPWIEWKTEKGFYLDVNYTDEIGTTAAAVKTFIHNKYNEGVTAGQAPTFLIIFGDVSQVPASQIGTESRCVTDLYYYTTDGDVFGDMFHSRMTAETVEEMNNILHKSLQYEQYTMPDPSYLSNVLLIAGWDADWNPKDGKPAIQYATNYYYNEAHGFDNVYAFLERPYNNTYASLNTGVGFVNYTAHGGHTEWGDPRFTNSDVNALTNTDKYFWAMGNCCQAADWGIGGKCLGEAFITAPNKGAFAYIGSCPSSYWYEDYYFAVGATNTFYAPPTYEESSMGVYDATFQDDFNSLSAVPFVGNLAVAYAHANNYTESTSDTYYWEAYHVLGDGSICTYHVNPTANSVSHQPTLPIGVDTYTVSAEPGSYVGISKDGVLYGAGEIGPDGDAEIPIIPITSGGNAKIVVTHPQRIPYIAEIPATSSQGPYVVYDNYQTTAAIVSGAYVPLDVTIKNVGVDPSNALTVTLSTDSEYVEIINSETNVPAVNPESTFVIENVFDFNIAVDVPDKEKVTFIVTCNDGSNTWESNFNVVIAAPSFQMVAVSSSDLEPGGSGTITFEITNKGTGDASNALLEVICCSDDITLSNNVMNIENFAAGETKTIIVNASVASDVEFGSTYEMGYVFSAGYYSINGQFLVSIGNIVEGFETGDFSMYEWQHSGPASWTVVTESPNSGRYCAKSGAITHSQNTDLSVTVDVLANGELTFYVKISSEQNFDRLFFYIDGSQVGQWSGASDWEQVSYNVTAGTHTFKWSYQKDNSVSNGFDCAWIDDIQLPPTNVVLALAPVTDLEATVEGKDVTLEWTAVEGATAYIVRRNGEEVGTVSNTTFTETVATDGIYTYSVIATNDGHYSAPANVTVSVGTVGIEEAEAEFHIYPNPTNSNLNINGGNAEYSFAIYNGMGQVVINGNAQGTRQVNVSDLTKGVYFIRITSGTQTSIQKFVVE